MNTIFDFQRAQVAAATPVGGLDPEGLRELGLKPDQPVAQGRGSASMGRERDQARLPGARPMSDVTQILHALSEGRSDRTEELLPLVYHELRRLAAWQLANERPGQTLQATALVHEAYLRLVGKDDPRWNGRRHFFGAAAEAMRRILIDNARRKQAVRHGGGLQRTALDAENLPIAAGAPEDELLAVDEALEALTAHDARKAELVKLRYFAGLTLEEAATAMVISVRTAKRDWAYARAWLYREMTRRRG